MLATARQNSSSMKSTYGRRVSGFLWSSGKSSFCKWDLRCNVNPADCTNDAASPTVIPTATEIVGGSANALLGLMLPSFEYCFQWMFRYLFVLMWLRTGLSRWLGGSVLSPVCKGCEWTGIDAVESDCARLFRYSVLVDGCRIQPASERYHSWPARGEWWYIGWTF